MIHSQEISRYYDAYRSKEIILTKELVKTIGLDPKQVYIKCGETQWPCIINSTSLAKAKIIIGVRGGAYAMLTAKDVGNISIRFGFTQQGKPSSSFLISTKITSIEPYAAAQDFVIVDLTFEERPADEFIEIIGSTIEANQNYINRREERIVIGEESKQKLCLAHEETVIFIQHVPRHCIIRDVSFSGAKIILMGLAPFLMGKQIQLRVEFNDPHEIFNIVGVIVAAEEISARKEVISASMKFDAQTVPMSYKKHISTYLSGLQKSILNR